MSPAAKSSTAERSTAKTTTAKATAAEDAVAENTAEEGTAEESGSAAASTTNGVVIIGMGPGDPGLLTLRAAAELERADTVIVNRALCPAEILSHCRPDVEIIDSAAGEPAKLAARAAKGAAGSRGSCGATRGWRAVSPPRAAPCRRPGSRSRSCPACPP